MRRWLSLAAVFLVLVGLCASASAQSCASKVDLYCTVNNDGDCMVNMTVSLHLDSADSGLMFPLPPGAQNIRLNGSSVATSTVGNRILAAVGTAIGSMTGDFSLRFDFDLPGAVAVNENRELALNLPMLCGFDYPVQMLSFIITLPDEITTVPAFTSTYQQTGFISNLELVVSGNMITGSTISTLNDGEAVQLTLPVPREMFPGVSVYQRTGNPELIPMGVLAGLAILYWLIFLRSLPPLRLHSTHPPQGVGAGELGCRVTMTGGDMTMMVLSWAQLGYVLIRREKDRVLLRKQMEMGSERPLFEIRMFNELFAKRSVVSCASSGYARLCRKAAQMIPGEKAMCRPGSGSRKVYRWLLCAAQCFCGICVTMNLTSIPALQVLFCVIFGVLSALSAWQLHEVAIRIFARGHVRLYIALAITAFWTILGAAGGQPWIPLVACLLQVLLGFPAAFGGKRTDLNRQEAGEILALRRYLRAIPRPEAAHILKSDPEYFFRMAPYAIALGVGNRFADTFGRRPLEPCPYLIIRNPVNRTAADWMRQLTATVAMMDSRYNRMNAEKWMAIRFR